MHSSAITRDGSPAPGVQPGAGLIRTRFMRRLVRQVVALALTGLSLGASAQSLFESGANICGSLENHFGPFDYWTTPQVKLRLVEKHHLDYEMAVINRGQIKGQMIGNFGFAGGGLDYTLRALPNHPVALSAIDRYVQLAGTERAPGLQWGGECYFTRAIDFKPDDPAARVIYATYLQKRNRDADANKQINEALKYKPQNVHVSYNLGLVLARLKRYDEALKIAHEVYADAYPLPGLQDILKKNNRWREIPPALIAARRAAQAEKAAEAAQASPQTPGQATTGSNMPASDATGSAPAAASDNAPASAPLK